MCTAGRRMLNGRSSSSRPGDREEQEHLNQLLFGPAVFVPQELPTQDGPPFDTFAFGHRRVPHVRVELARSRCVRR
jgi:hypothetical protein